MGASSTPESPLATGLSQPPAGGYALTSRVIQWSHAWPSAALAVLIAAFPLTLILGVPPGPSMLAAGFLCVVLYRRRTYAARLTAGLGARLGAICGAMGFGALLVALAVGASVFHSGAKIRQDMVDLIQRSLANAPDEQTKAQVLDFFQTPAGLAVALLGVAVGFLIFSGLGGALGAALLRRKQRP
ncbi:MAG: hypothetical protein LAO03_04760 [Acidobacteriia bacterium]|nr:hypothetical protein [Terriglobia bacterium]